MFKRIFKCISRPNSQTIQEYARLDEHAIDLVDFHRAGFGVEPEGYINEIFIGNVVRDQAAITAVISHFIICC